MTDLSKLIAALPEDEYPATVAYHTDGRHNFMLHGAFGIRYIRESKCDAALAELLEKLGERDREATKWHDVAWKLAQRQGYEGFRQLGIPASQEHIDSEASILICDTEAAWEEMHRARAAAPAPTKSQVRRMAAQIEDPISKIDRVLDYVRQHHVSPAVAKRAVEAADESTNEGGES